RKCISVYGPIFLDEPWRPHCVRVLAVDQQRMVPQPVVVVGIRVIAGIDAIPVCIRRSLDGTFARERELYPYATWSPHGAERLDPGPNRHLAEHPGVVTAIISNI